tara:strand:- start:88 stop:594 length:507 start_codon:yes stop_codon:yes gene_type:complete
MAPPLREGELVAAEESVGEVEVLLRYKYVELWKLLYKAKNMEMGTREAEEAWTLAIQGIREEDTGGDYPLLFAERSLARTYLKMFSDAFDDAEKSLSLSPTCTGYYALGMVYEESGHLDLALETYESGLRYARPGASPLAERLLALKSSLQEESENGPYRVMMYLAEK